MSDLLLNGTPENMRLPSNVKGARLMTSDVFNVCARIKEIDRSLYVVVHEKHEKPFVVMENCVDGEQRMVKRYERLDSTILEDLQRMLNMPWEKRFKALARETDEHNRKLEESFADNEALEKLTFEMGKALRESGIATGRVAPTYMFRGKKK